MGKLDLTGYTFLGSDPDKKMYYQFLDNGDIAHLIIMNKEAADRIAQEHENNPIREVKPDGFVGGLEIKAEDLSTKSTDSSTD